MHITGMVSGLIPAESSVCSGDFSSLVPANLVFCLGGKAPSASLFGIWPL